MQVWPWRQAMEQYLAGVESRAAEASRAREWAQGQEAGEFGWRAEEGNEWSVASECERAACHGPCSGCVFWLGLGWARKQLAHTTRPKGYEGRPAGDKGVEASPLLVPSLVWLVRRVWIVVVGVHVGSAEGSGLQPGFSDEGTTINVGSGTRCGGRAGA